MLESTPYMMGDSAQDSDRKTEFKKFTEKFAAIAEGRFFPFTLQLRDPLANSYIGTLLDVDFKDDHQLSITDYDRTYDEDDELGLHDIDVGEDFYTSSEGESNPNRAVMHKRWGPDHPHNFAKGCDDNTIPTPITDAKEGDYATYESEKAAAAASSELEEVHIVEAPHVPLVKICEDDEDFTNSFKFQGSRAGFVFKNGEKGCGYYRDVMKK
jgi:hypothetical protein